MKIEGVSAIFMSTHIQHWPSICTRSLYLAEELSAFLFQPPLSFLQLRTYTVVSKGACG